MSHILCMVAGHIDKLTLTDDGAFIAKVDAAGGTIYARIPTRLTQKARRLPLQEGAGVSLQGTLRFDDQQRAMLTATRLNVFSRGNSNRAQEAAEEHF